MKFECMNCEKIISDKDAREGEIILSVQTGGFGNIQGWKIECEECYQKRKTKEKEESE
jgi:hypothetical protein